MLVCSPKTKEITNFKILYTSDKRQLFNQFDSDENEMFIYTAEIHTPALFFTVFLIAAVSHYPAESRFLAMSLFFLSPPFKIINQQTHILTLP
jgi:hypothetical protein